MIGILDYGMGNISSVINTLEFLRSDYKIINSNIDFNQCSHLIIPGVGSFGKAMSNIENYGLKESIKKFAKSGKPVLGICLGMQLLADVGFEPEETIGLGLIPGEVLLIDFEEVRIPHIGWNGINVINDHPILKGVKLSADFYFVHSYHYIPKSEESIITTTEYGDTFVSIIQNKQKNVIGIQFHPEKSQKQGLKIIDNFINMNIC